MKFTVSVIKIPIFIILFSLQSDLIFGFFTNCFVNFPNSRRSPGTLKIYEQDIDKKCREGCKACYND